MADTPNLFGVKLKAKRKAEPLPDGTMHRLIMLWVALFERRFKEKPVITPPDAAALKRLAAERGADIVARRLEQYLALDDRSFEAIEGYPLSLLPRAWNKLVVQDHAPASRVQDAESTARYLRGLKGGR